MKKVISMLIVLFMLGINISAIEIPNVDEALIFDTNSKEFKTEGKWSTSNLIGYDNTNVSHINAGAGSNAEWDIVFKGGVCKLYYWNCLKEDGCIDAEMTISCTTVTETKTINMSRGNSGWIEIGLYNISDGRINIKITGNQGVLLVNSVMLVPQQQKYKSIALLNKKLPDNIMLKLNSDVAYVASIKQQISDALPFEQNGTTFVPIRFIAQSLNCGVEWKTDRAVITTKDMTLEFFENSNIYTYNGEEKQLTANVINLNDRLMVPIRVISESMNKKVFWDDRGLIVISDSETLDKIIDEDLINELVRIYD